jgi:hypothetical protein
MAAVIGGGFSRRDDLSLPPPPETSFSIRKDTFAAGRDGVELCLLPGAVETGEKVIV